MSSVSSSPVVENPWLRDDMSLGSAFSSPKSSPQRAKVSSSSHAENPWFGHDVSMGSAFSSPASSPYKAQKTGSPIKKRTAEFAGFEEGYSPQKASPVSSPGSSPFKKKRTSSSAPRFEPIRKDVSKKTYTAARRSLKFVAEDVFFNAGNFSPPEKPAIKGDELTSLQMELQEGVSRIFRENLSGRELLTVRFSQNSIAEETKDGHYLKDIVYTLAKKGWDKGKASMTLVRMADGELTSLDNRRLYCAKECITERRPRLVVPVRIHDHAVLADPSYLDEIAGQVRRVGAAVLGAMPQEIIPNSWGYCVWARMRVFNKTPIDSKSYGFTDLPKVIE
jgi:hypothetical protein